MDGCTLEAEPAWLDQRELLTMGQVLVRGWRGGSRLRGASSSCPSPGSLRLLLPGLPQEMGDSPQLPWGQPARALCKATHESMSEITTAVFFTTVAFVPVCPPSY